MFEQLCSKKKRGKLPIYFIASNSNEFDPFGEITEFTPILLQTQKKFWYLQRLCIFFVSKGCNGAITSQSYGHILDKRWKTSN